jgi:hypothetical protein
MKQQHQAIRCLDGGWGRFMADTVHGCQTLALLSPLFVWWTAVLCHKSNLFRSQAATEAKESAAYISELIPNTNHQQAFWNPPRTWKKTHHQNRNTYIK